MRQLRRGAPLGWLLALLFPLLVSGGLSGGGVTALLGHPAVATAAGEHRPLSRQVHPGREQHAVTAGLLGAGAGGGHPVAARPPDAPLPSLDPGLGSHRARDDDPRPPAAPLLHPSRAPPSTGV
ncbi:hypothetical protein ACQPYK_45055 [Streptosporangium sp. CA-135522]|uniref:hypothetical protein n=1 Tax=Streptosporangium sp. CA-135522 TaxID=3240072 RepID=UPI003D9221AA